MNKTLLLLIFWLTACAGSGGKLKEATPVGIMDTIYLAPYLNKAFIMSSTSAVSYIRHFVDMDLPLSQVLALYHTANSPLDSSFAHFQLDAWGIDSVHYSKEDSSLRIDFDSLPIPYTLAGGHYYVHEGFEKAFMNSFYGTLYSFPSILKARIYMDGNDLTETAFINLEHAGKKSDHLYNPGLFYVKERANYQVLSILPCWHAGKEMGYVPVHHDPSPLAEFVQAHLALGLAWELDIGAGLQADSVRQAGNQLAIYLRQAPEEAYKLENTIKALAYSLVNIYKLRYKIIELNHEGITVSYEIVYPDE